MEEHDNKLDEIFLLAVEHWNKNFVGISGIDLSEKLDKTNEEIMSSMEKLNELGLGSLRRNVQLFVTKIDLENHKVELPDKPITTHVFFPSKELLSEHYYNSALARQKLPEYKARMHQGGQQLELVYFSYEVLARYFNHPEYYELNDTLSGGKLWAKEEAPENRYLYIRFGKRRQINGIIAVTVILQDLSEMSPEEQRYWHAHELENIEPASKDPNFERFVARNYDGAWVDYPSPIKDINEALEQASKVDGEIALFKKFDNSHLRFPVENTYKSLCDCCSELYKLVGPDNLNQEFMKSILMNRFHVPEDALIHKDSGRALSTLQLLTLLEEKLKIGKRLSVVIKKIGKYRIDADHKIIEESAGENYYVETFENLCHELNKELRVFCREMKNT